MSLRKRTLLLLGSLILFILLSLYSTSQLIFRYNFKKIEANTAEHNLERLQAALNNKLTSIQKKTESLAASELVDEFLNPNRPTAYQDQTAQNLLILNDLDLIAVVDSSEQVIYGMLYNPNLDSADALPIGIKAHLSTGGLLVNSSIADSSIAGIIGLTEGPMLVVSSNIDVTASAKNFKGRVIFGCYFDEAMIRELAQKTHIWANYHLLNQPDLPETVAEVYKANPNRQTYIQSEGENRYAAYSLVRDIYRQPALLLSIEAPRQIYHTGIDYAKYFTFAMLLFAFIVGGFLPLILEKLIFSRLSLLHREVKNISEKQDLCARLSLRGKDELTDLSSEINKMLETMEGNELQLQEYSKKLEILVSEKMLELQMNEEMLRSIILHSPAAIFLTDTNGIVQDCNQAALALTGNRLMKDLLDIPLASILKLEGNTYFARDWERLVQQGSLRNEEYEISFDGVEIVYTELCASEIRDHNNDPVYYVVIIRDISERMRHIKALELSEHRYKQLFDKNLAGVFSVSLEGYFLDCNESFKEILGIAHKNELNGINIDTYYKSPLTGQSMLNMVRRHGSISNIEHQINKPNGDVIWVLGNASLVEKGDIDDPYILVTIFDINDAKLTQQREREMELELMQQSKLADVGLLAAGIAHNLKVPLHAIMGQIELMQLTGNESTYLDDMMKQAQLITDIVNNILKKTRNEQSQETREIDLNELLEEELKFLSADLYYKHNINKEFNFDPNLPPVKGVYSDYSQAIMNCVKNAIDAMHHTDEKSLSIRTQACGECEIVVEIEDSGTGIPQDVQEKIFKPFFTTKPLAGEQKEGEPFGTGLGLSSSLNLIEKYNGRIELESEVDKGTLIRIFIPAAPTEEKNDMEHEDEVLVDN